MADGILIEQDDSEYFASPALDQSQLKQYLRNPAEWAYGRLYGEHNPTPAMIFGTAFHAYLLGTQNVVSLPEGADFRKKENKLWRDEQIMAGNIVVSHQDMQLLERMTDNMRQEAPECIEMIERGLCEQSIEWTDERTGLRLKAKPDLIPSTADYLVDLKTTASAAADDFARESFKYGYHIQAEFYRKAVSEVEPSLLNREEEWRFAPAMQFWTFEKTGACDWARYSISGDGEYAKAARNSIRSALGKIATAVEMGEQAGLGEGLDAAAKWSLRHGYPKDVREIEPTNWVMQEAQVFV